MPPKCFIIIKFFFIVLREGFKERFEVPADYTSYAKISTEGKAFPLRFSVFAYEGDYTIYISNKFQKPGPDNSEFKFVNDRNFSITIREMYSSWIFIGVAAHTHCHILVKTKFNGFEE